MTITLDIEQPDALLIYLRQGGYIEADERPEMLPLRGGVSNRTVLVKRGSGEAWVIKQALEKLRVPVDWFSSPERVHREAAGLRWLADLAPPGTIPEPVFEDHEHHLLAMQAVPQPHENWKTMLLAGKLETDHIRQFGRLLATIHRRAYERRSEVAGAFDDRTFFESLRLEPYYGYTAEQVTPAAPFLYALMDETRARRLTLVHGDYSPKNILVYQNRLILLDHEVIHFGDPAFDLGFSMTHFLSKARHLTEYRNAFAQAANFYWQTYRQTLGDLPWAGSLEPFAVRHTLACLLARVAGRSPLEYLSPEEKDRQQQAVVRLMSNTPDTISALIQQVTAQVGLH
jgi:aminoglycoside phosphotransferase (APT) family kinase protein